MAFQLYESSTAPGLCKLCKSILYPEHSVLPGQMPEIAGDDISVLKLTGPLADRIQDEPPGFKFHNTLEALSTSASDCPLCHLINESTQELDIDPCADLLKPADDYDDDERNPALRLEQVAESQLWITARHNGKPGFMVFSRATQAPQTVLILAIIGFCVDSTSPLASQIQARPVQEDASSPNVLAIAASWLDNCVTQHDDCRNESSDLPSRLLDVLAFQSLGRIKLVGTSGLSAQYIALSHCWGENGHFTTSKATMQLRMQGIPMTDLPKTFRDAVVITARLGIRYLWIDSLCICQDDQEDWARESAKMTAVYANAHLTIAADHGEDSSAGCFNTRLPRQVAPLHLIDRRGIGSDAQAFKLPQLKEFYGPGSGSWESQPLSKRAWVLQERAIARRTLHFCKDQIYYECHREFISEDGLCGKRELEIAKRLDASLSYNTRSSDRQLWYQLLHEYGRRNLTFPTDKLPAMSGLARLFESRLKTSYVAGLWSDALIGGLAWSRKTLGILSKKLGPDASKLYIAPSWSWAAQPDHVYPKGEEEFTEIARVEGYHVELKNVSNPYGEIRSAWIRLRAPLLRLSLCERPTVTAEDDPSDDDIKMVAQKCRLVGRSAFLDSHTETSRDELLQVDLYALILGSDQKIGGKDRSKPTGVLENEDRLKKPTLKDVTDYARNIVYRALILVPTNENNDTMRRIGFIYLDPVKDNGCKGSELDSEIQTATLV